MMMEKPVEKKKKSAEEAVKDLEKRLAALSSASLPSSATATTITETPDLNFAKLNSAPLAPTPASVTTQPGQVKGGKNALLARIMAAQEKAKEAKSVAPPAISTVAHTQQMDLLGPPPPVHDAPPPAYDTDLLSPPPTQDIAPPPTFDAVENTVMSQVQPPNYFAAAPPPPPPASAPAFEDLLGTQQTLLPPPMQEAAPEEEMIMGFQGMSPEERRGLMDEQRKIMEQIEREKNANKAAIAAAQADNFNMRSINNAVVDQSTAGMSKEETAQMEEDRRMAEQLQNQEYEEADGVAAARAPRQVQQSAPTTDSSWWDTVTGMFSTSEVPGAQQNRTSHERESLTGAPRRPAGVRSAARVAESKPLFSCVVDTVNTTVGTLTGSAPDAEGNVHGVDSSSLLAISNVGRENPNNS